MGIPADVTDATTEYRESQDVLKDFIVDCCLVDIGNPDVWVTAVELREAYDNWARSSGERFGVGGNKFSEALKRRGCEPDVKRLANKTARVWNGIRVIIDQ